MASIPSPIRKWIRRYITGEGSNEIANQSPVQSVNSQTGDVTISTGGGSIPPSQTVTSYSDLPTTDLSEAEIWLVAGEEDVVVSTQLSPVVWRSVSDFTKVASQIPDTSMFQSPIYQWAGAAIDASDGTSPVDWPESLAGLPDATAQNTPEKQTISGKEAVLYNESADYHTFSPDSQLPTGSESFSIAATVYLNDNDDETIIGWGNDSSNKANVLGITTQPRHAFFANDINGSTTISTGTLQTVGVRYDGSNRKIYLNGSGDVSDTPGAVNVQDANHRIAASPPGVFQNAYNGYIHDIVVSEVAESDQAFSDYHSNRVA